MAKRPPTIYPFHRYNPFQESQCILVGLAFANSMCVRRLWHSSLFCLLSIQLQGELWNPSLGYWGDQIKSHNLLWSASKYLRGIGNSTRASPDYQTSQHWDLGSVVAIFTESTKAAHSTISHSKDAHINLDQYYCLDSDMWLHGVSGSESGLGDLQGRRTKRHRVDCASWQRWKMPHPSAVEFNIFCWIASSTHLGYSN